MKKLTVKDVRRALAAVLEKELRDEDRIESALEQCLKMRRGNITAVLTVLAAFTQRPAVGLAALYIIEQAGTERDFAWIAKEANEPAVAIGALNNVHDSTLLGDVAENAKMAAARFWASQRLRG